MIKYLNLPLTEEEIMSLHYGDILYLSGTIYTARDAAHQKIVEAIQNNQALPLELNNACIYYVGPTPKKHDFIFGSAGPTSSYRMDKYSPIFLANGLKITIGKGARSSETIELFKKYHALYLCAIGGAGVVAAASIKDAKLIAYPEFASEAIYELKIENFMTVVGIDAYGNDLFTLGPKEYNEKKSS